MTKIQTIQWEKAHYSQNFQTSKRTYPKNMEYTLTGIAILLIVFNTSEVSYLQIMNKWRDNDKKEMKTHT